MDATMLADVLLNAGLSLNSFRGVLTTGLSSLIRPIPTRLSFTQTGLAVHRADLWNHILAEASPIRLRNTPLTPVQPGGDPAPRSPAPHCLVDRNKWTNLSGREPPMCLLFFLL